jgi:hypothetical protein
VTESVPESDSAEKSLFQLTRELELLISAGLVLALLQLPDVLDAWWVRNSVHVGGAAFGTVFTLYYVGKLVAYGLIVAIAAHFLLRGFWVAIMGLRSVFPAGVVGEKLDQGEVYRKFYEGRLLSLEEIENRVDRIAASIFAFVFLFLLIFMMLAVWGVVAWIVAFIATAVAGTEEVVMPVLATIFAIYVIMTSFAAIIDKRSKSRPVSPASEKLALRIMGWVYYPTFNFIYAPVFFTFASHSSRRKMSALLVTFLYSMIGFFMISVFFARGIFGFDSYIYYPSQPGEHQLRAMHYDNLRDDDVPAEEPSIQSDVVEDPYLRLFVPYDAREDNERMHALCPGVAPLRDDGFFVSSRRRRVSAARIAQLAGCFDKIYQIALDGRPVEKPGFVFYRHPHGRVAGRLALIPVTSLAAGRHMLTVRHTPLPGLKKDEDADEFFIPFWR